jgi:predicted nucleic acid-binding protein
VTHLDSSFLIDVLRESSREAPGPASFLLRKLEDEDLAISIFVECELYAGAEMARNPDKELEKVESLLDALMVDPPHEQFSRTYGKVLAKMERSGQRVATMDLLIAVAALCSEATLVTRNAKDFSRIPGLKILTYS